LFVVIVVVVGPMCMVRCAIQAQGIPQ